METKGGMSKSTERKLAIIFGMALTVLLINAVISYRYLTRLIMNGTSVIHALEVIGELEGLVSTLREGEVGQRGYLISGNEDYIRRIDAIADETVQRITKLRPMVADSSLQEERLQQLEKAAHERLGILNKNIDIRRRLGFEAVQKSFSTDEGRRAMERVLTEAGAMKNTEKTLLSDRTAEARASAWWAMGTFSIATILALGFLGAGFLLVQRDVVQRQQSERVIRESECRKTAILESALDAIITTDEHGTILEFNPAAERIFGYPREQAVGKDLAELIIPPKLRNRHRDGLARYASTGKGSLVDQRIEMPAVRADGTEFPCEMAISPIATEGPPLFTAYLRDITSRKRAERALQDSEERSRLLLNSTSEGIYGTDVNGLCMFCNPACLSLLGYTEPGQLLGKHLHSLIHHTRADGTPYPDLECRINESFRTSKPTHADDEVFWRADGTSFPVEYRTSPILSDRKTIGAVVTFADITQRQLAEETMRLRDRSLKAIGQGLFITDPSRSDEPIIYVNAAFEHMTGYTQAETAGSDIRALLEGPETDPVALQEIRDAFREGREAQVELLSYCKDRTTFWNALAVSPVQDAAGRVTHFVGVMTDISEPKRAQEELRLAKEAAEAASRSKSTFLANMSHELRTPLNAIMGYSEMLQEEAEDAERNEFVPDLQKIHAAGKHLLGLINDILDLSKIEAGKMELYLETFDVAEMVDGVASTIRPLVERNANTLEVRCGESLGAMHSDLTKVRQALLNLLSNASKFTEHGTITLEVERERADDKDWLVLRVRDTGIGMTAEQLNKLFQPFTQADASTTRKYGGTGLGLTITRRFCQMMGGDVIVKSKPDEGSTFTLRLPAAAPERPPELVADEPSGRSAPLGRANVILVIDDDPTVRDLMRRALEKEGFQVHGAVNGEDGLRLARQVRPDAITLDVMMPGMDGWLVLSALKADADLAEIPVVMVTIVDDKNLGYSLGASDYLTKPIDRRRLATVLRKYRRALPGGNALVVDDDEATRVMVRQLLEADSWSVTEAENGRIALERVADAAPDLIVLDLMMPELDGFGFAEELRRHPAWREIPILVVTAKDLSEQDRKRLNGHILGILQKGPYTREQLVTEIRREVVGRVRQETAPAAS
jgi:PAS domain S-box-containing protein